MRVLGVDACKGGWIAVALKDGRLHEFQFVSSIDELIGDSSAVIAIDTPLGETVPCDRGADRAARRYMKPRSSVVFSAAPLVTLETSNYQEGLALARALFDTGISSQAWHLGPKMLDARTHWCADPWRFREVHPECSFRAMAKRPLAPKKSWTGMLERLGLLASAGIDLLKSGYAPPSAVGVDDLIDAAAAAWSAHRIATNCEFSLPDPPERDADGRPVAVWV